MKKDTILGLFNAQLSANAALAEAIQGLREHDRSKIDTAIATYISAQTVMISNLSVAIAEND